MNNSFTLINKLIMSNFKTLGDINKKKDENKNRESYVGGEQSGLAVEDDPGLVGDIIRKAQ